MAINQLSLWHLRNTYHKQGKYSFNLLYLFVWITKTNYLKIHNSAIFESIIKKYVATGIYYKEPYQWSGLEFGLCTERQ